jgi:16S rRNA (adenine1518-N6/adenine1519-N6)-dimethyltransferase
MLQREVADRVLAQPGTKSYGVLSILLSLHAAPARLLDLPPGAFRPKPKVHSSVVRLTFRPPPVRVVDEDLFERVVKQMFSQRRKTLANALKGFSPAAPDILRTCGLDVKRRPETLAIGEIAALVEQFRAVGTGPVL